MSKIVQKRTNTGTGQHWLRQLARKAGSLGKHASWREVKEGYILQAKRVGRLRSATLLDLPPLVRVVGNFNGLPGTFFGQPKVKVGGSRDAFSPASAADPKVLSTEDLESAQYPTGWDGIFIGPQPAFFGIFTGAALPTSNDRTKLTFSGDSTTNDLVLFYPLAESRDLFARVEFLNKGDRGMAVTTLESAVTALTGGFVMSTRDVDGSSGETTYPVSIPNASTDYDPLSQTVVVSTPIVETIPKSEEDWGIDYGEVAMFVTRTFDISTESPTTQLFLVQFPTEDFFEQPLWFSEESRGYVPAIIYSELVLTPNGGHTLYGTYYSFVYGGAAEVREDFEQMQTRFRVDMDASGGLSWTVLSCNVSGTDSGLNGRRLNSVQGQFDWFEKPVVFYGAGSPWAFWIGYDIPSSGLSFGGGGGATIQDSFISITQGSTEVARGVPPNITMFRALGTGVTLLKKISTGSIYFSAYVAVHVDTPEVFGISFFGWDRTTDELKLCKWDSVDGFGIWDLDLTAMNARVADRLPSISVYQMCSVVESAVVGQPSFVANSEFGNGNNEAFIIASGVAKSIGPLGGLQTVALGNDLQTTALNSLYER